MDTFSKRNRLKKEYSGYGMASISLRNRLLQLYGLPFSGDEYNFGLGNTNWIHEVAFDKDLQMNFGRKIPIEHFRIDDLTTYDEVFDFIEIYYQRAVKDLDYNKRFRLFNEIVSAFQKSGSVYEFSGDGNVIVKIEANLAENITDIDKLLSPLKDAQDVFRSLVDGLIARSKEPKDIVSDMYIVLEDYCKKVTNKNTFEKAVVKISNHLSLHRTQVKLIDNLKAYRGDVWGTAHAGNSPKPNEEDAKWYIDSTIAQIKYIASKLEQSPL